MTAPPQRGNSRRVERELVFVARMERSRRGGTFARQRGRHRACDCGREVEKVGFQADGGGLIPMM